jgi:predicted small metal-binding protein
MAKVINCECRLTLRAETDQEVLAAANEHIRVSHPDLVDVVTEDQLRTWIQEA